MIRPRERLKSMALSVSSAAPRPSFGLVVFGTFVLLIAHWICWPSDVLSRDSTTLILTVDDAGVEHVSASPVAGTGGRIEGHIVVILERERRPLGLALEAFGYGSSVIERRVEATAMGFDVNSPYARGPWAPIVDPGLIALVARALRDDLKQPEFADSLALRGGVRPELDVVQLGKLVLLSVVHATVAGYVLLATASSWYRHRGQSRLRLGQCPKCRYPMRMTSTRRCSECGYEVSPDERRILEAIVLESDHLARRAKFESTNTQGDGESAR